MPGKPLPKFQDWPQQHEALTPVGIQSAYERGWIGAFSDKKSEEELRDLTKRTSGYESLADIAHDRGWADSGKDKLVIPFIHVMRLWPGCYPGDAQTVGSCVSHSQKNALLLTLGCEIAAAQPDPVTGKIEGPPEVPPEGIKSGVLSPAPIYWTRGYNGHGWSCPTAARNCVGKVGCVVAKNYEELGVDLTNVTRSIECLYGSRQAPEAWQQEFKKHTIQAVAEINSFEELRDALANGYGVSTCGSEGYSSTRDENGVSRRRGSWAHAMACLGVDDRPEIKQVYGEPLVWNQNSWGNWNSGPLLIRGTSIEGPPGGMWIRWSEYKNRYMVAMSNVAGWPARKLPTYGAEFL